MHHSWSGLTALPIETDVEGKGPRMTTAAAGNGNFTPQEDVVALLQAQHDQIRALLIQLEDEPDTDTFQWLVRLLAVHETAEEQVIYPYLADHVEGAADVVAARRDEEREGKEALAQLEKMDVPSADFAAGFSDLHEAVDRHAAAEEAEVFPLLRGLDPPRRTQMAESFRLVESVAPTHPHPHSPDGPLGNLLVGSFAAISDRVRDALHDRH